MSAEQDLQSAIRLEYAKRGYRLWRNNSGALRDQHGRLVRFGLGNDSAVVNEQLKSSDLIGWRSAIVTPDMLGTTIARFVSFEVKHPNWHLTLGDKRAQAQARWLALVAADGGEARFMTGVD